MKNYNKNLIALSVAMALTTSSTFASELNTDKDVKEDMEVIVVKSGKRIKTLNEIPASVTVIGGEKLEDMNITNIQDLSSSLPNVHISNDPAGDVIAIRGISSNLRAGGEQSVGLFVDGVFHGKGPQSRFSFLDVGTVEVLRGPKGAVFGKNTIAGVIAINPAQPKDDFEAKISAGYEVEYEKTETNGYVTGSLNDDDSLTGRLAFKYSDQDSGHMTNEAHNSEGPQTTDESYRGILNWQASDQLNFNLRVDDGNIETKGTSTEFVVVDGPFAPLISSVGVEGNLDGHTNSSNSIPGLGFRGEDTDFYMELDFSEQALKADYKLDSGTVTALIAHSEYELARSQDADYTPLSIAQLTEYEDHEQDSAELRFVSNDSDDFEYLFGLYYQSEDFNSDAIVDFNTGPTSLIANMGLPFQPEHDITSRSNGIKQEVDTWAVFGQIGYGITDSLKLELSARYSEEEKKAVQHARTYGGGNGVSSGAPLTNPVENFVWSVALLEVTPHDFAMQRNEYMFSPAASLIWTLNDETSLYATTSKGYKAGGFNSFAQQLDDIEYEDEKATSYEVGGKFDLFDGQARLNIAAFSGNFEDMQQSLFTGGTSFIIKNAAEATTRGIEADWVWFVGDSVTLDGSLAYLDFEFDSYPNAACTYDQMIEGGFPNNSLCLAAEGNDLSGKTTEDVPELKATLGIEYQTMLGEYEFSSRLEANYTDEYFAVGDLDPNTKVDAFTLFNASATLTSPDGDWNVALIGRNLTDEDYYYNANDAPIIGGSHIATLRPGSTLMMRFSYTFGG